MTEAKLAIECGAIAAIVEYHRSIRPTNGSPDTYRTVWFGGNQDALREGGWIE